MIEPLERFRSIDDETLPRILKNKILAAKGITVQVNYFLPRELKTKIAID